MFELTIQTIIALHALLYFTDGLPFWHVVFGAFCQVVYLQHFSASWPYISLTSGTFLLSCVLVVCDHFMWFFHFAHVAQEAKRSRAARYRYHAHPIKEAPTFMEVASFFAICVWFIPLFLFLSLSANDNVIPSFGECVARQTTADRCRHHRCPATGCCAWRSCAAPVARRRVARQVGARARHGPHPADRQEKRWRRYHRATHARFEPRAVHCLAERRVRAVGRGQQLASLAAESQPDGTLRGPAGDRVRLLDASATETPREPELCHERHRAQFSR